MWFYLSTALTFLFMAESTMPKTLPDRRKTETAKDAQTSSRTHRSIDWMKGMPQKGSSKYWPELDRRVAKGRAIRVQAMVEQFDPKALTWTSETTYSGGQSAGSRLKLLKPDSCEGVTMMVYHDLAVPTGSCWSVPGCLVEYELNERILDLLSIRSRALRPIYSSSLKSTVFHCGNKDCLP